jgi:hypothetical protein
MSKKYKTNKVYFVIPKGYTTGGSFIKDNEKIISNYTDLSIYDMKDYIFADKTFINIRFTFDQPKLNRKEFNKLVESLKGVDKAFYKYENPIMNEGEEKLTYERTI